MGISDSVEIIMLATTRYNKSIHSVINKWPVDTIQGSTDDTQERIADKIKSTQDALRENASRQNRVFEVGEKVLVKTNRRLGNKLTPLCEEKGIQADMAITVPIEGRVVHKDNLK